MTEGGGNLGLLKGNKLASSVRIENIPIGTEFTVVDEYNYKNSYGYCVGAGSNIHYLIVQDEYGSLSEVSELDFRQKFQIDIDVTFEVNKDINLIIDNMNSLYLDKRLVLDFCIAEFIHESINPFKFIKYFKFENEMLVKEISVNDNNKQCRREYKIEFNSLSSYLTSVYYFQNWQLYGKWSRSRKI